MHFFLVLSPTFSAFYHELNFVCFSVLLFLFARHSVGFWVTRRMSNARHMRVINPNWRQINGVLARAVCDVQRMRAEAKPKELEKSATGKQTNQE